MKLELHPSDLKEASKDYQCTMDLTFDDFKPQVQNVIMRIGEALFCGRNGMMVNITAPKKPELPPELKGKLVLVYDEDSGCAIHLADGGALQFIKVAKPGRYEVNNAIIIEAARVAIKQNLRSDIVIMYKDKIIKVDDDGRITDWPVGFCDVLEEFWKIIFDF